NLALLNVFLADIAIAAGNHDRLVITAPLDAIGPQGLLLIAAEITGQIGTAEFIVEGSTTDGAFQHDLERRDDAFRLAVIEGFPGLDELGDPQVGNGKARQPGLGLATNTGGTFIANLAPGAGRGT